MAFEHKRDYAQVCKLYKLDESALVSDEGKRALIEQIWKRCDRELADAMITAASTKSGADLDSFLLRTVCRFYPDVVDKPSSSFLDRPRLFMAVTLLLERKPETQLTEVCRRLHGGEFKDRYKSPRVLNNVYSPTRKQVERIQQLRTPEVVARLQERLVSEYSKDAGAMVIWEEYKEACVAVMLASDAGDAAYEAWALSRIDAVFDSPHPFAKRLAIIRLSVQDGWCAMVRLCDYARKEDLRRLICEDFGLMAKSEQDALIDVVRLFVEAEIYRHRDAIRLSKEINK